MSKPWERPWTTQEMIDNASNWSLAGDAGLLKYLEDFSEKMLAKAKDTNDKLNDLIDNADEASLALNNATNAFMGLKNTQFIESRVYEDDETLPTKKEPEKEEPSKPNEADRLEEMKKAIFNGLDIIDKYYERVEIPESDSEDDTSEPNILYKPIDPYMDRPLPYVIGTPEWHKYWHVGLAHSSSESEVENEQDQFSETESEHEVQNLPPRDRSQIPGISDSEAEDIPKTKISKPVANSTFNDDTNKNMFDSSSDSEAGSLPPQVNTVNSNFAEELAAKLGKVDNATSNPEINKRPIKKTPAGGLFSDEPPPLDDDIFVNKNMNSGLFSGGNGLFDDTDNDSEFWNNKKSTSAPVAKSSDDLFAENTKKSDENISKISRDQSKKSHGLFDEDDDDLFSTPSLTQPKKPVLPIITPKTVAPLLSNEPPELEPNLSTEEEPKRKKPVGGISILGPNNLLAQQIGKVLKDRAPSSSDSENDSESVEQNINKSTEVVDKPIQDVNIPTENKKIPSLFDDTSPLFSDDIFSNISSKKFTSSLFDSEPPALEDDLFKSKTKKPQENVEKKQGNIEKKKSLSLFDDSPTADDDLFKYTEKKSEKVYENKNEEIDNSKFISKTLTQSTSLFKENINKEDDLFKKIQIEDENKIDNVKNKSIKTPSLFDDHHDVEDDLFTSIKKADVTVEQNVRNVNQFVSKTVPLFDNNPPVDNENEKLQQNIEKSIDQNKENKSLSIKKSLFDDKPELKDDLFSNKLDDKSASTSQNNLKKSLGLFEDEDDLFSTTNTNKSHSSLCDPNPPALFNESSSAKKDRTIDLFDPNPPDLDESDGKSESQSQLSLENEPISYGSADVARASLFDTEPPLLSNESSGIVRDQSSRLESDSSFTPCMTSSRRYSTDLFQDHTTSDSLFTTTRNKLSLPAETKSDLSKIPEHDTLTKIEITPSGNESSLVDDSSVFPNISEKLQSPKTTEKSKTKNLFLFNESDSDDDLFSNKSSGSKNSSTSDLLNNSVKPLKNKNIFEDDLFAQPNLSGVPDVDIFSKNIEDGDQKSTINVKEDNKDKASLFQANNGKKFNYEDNLESDEDKKVDPKKSLNLEKSVKIDKTEEVDGQILSSSSSPSKIKHNLNINVAALLPGASPPRKQNLEKSVSLDSSENNPNLLDKEEVIKSDVKTTQSKPVLEKSISFDCPVETNEILTSAAKERIRIPVRRRPSTRKARHEAIRKSAIDLIVDVPITESDNKTESQNILNLANNNNNNNMSAKTIEIEDATKPNEQQNNDKTNDNSEESKTNPLSPSTDEEIEGFLTMPRDKDLSDNFEDNSLFGAAPVFSPIANTPNIVSNESKTVESKSDDLFNVKASDLFETKPSVIFSSSESENDLFCSPPTTDSNEKSNVVSISSGLDNNNLSRVDDLFKSVQSTTNTTANSANLSTKALAVKDSLFGEDDDDDDDNDIFSRKNIPAKTNMVKKSLFDDDDDDDIFGELTSKSGANSSVKSQQQQQQQQKSAVVTSRLRKLSTDPIQDIDDPLNALNK